MKITMDEILMMNALSQVTGVSPKDCIIQNQLVTYLVPEKLVGKAIGKGATNVKMLEKRLNKRVEIIPYSEKPEEVFARALEVNIAGSKISGKKVVIMLSAEEKSKAFKNNNRIKRVRELLERNFNLELVIF